LEKIRTAKRWEHKFLLSCRNPPLHTAFHGNTETEVVYCFHIHPSCLPRVPANIDVIFTFAEGGLTSGCRGRTFSKLIGPSIINQFTFPPIKILSPGMFKVQLKMNEPEKNDQHWSEYDQACMGEAA
jgi:hypothetical protein